MNAPRSSRYQAVPRVPARFAKATVSGRMSGEPPANTSATSRSFQTQRNWKMPKAASAGRQQRQHDREEDPDVAGAVDACRLDELARAPAHEVVQEEDASGSAKMECESQTVQNVPARPAFT